MIRSSSVSASFPSKGECEIGPDKERRWGAIETDIAALVSFFDLLVLHDQVPAFNYPDMFDDRVQLHFRYRLPRLSFIQ